jgi:hypothetical protein
VFRSLWMLVAVGVATAVLFAAARGHDRYADDDAPTARVRKAPSPLATPSASSARHKK